MGMTFEEEKRDAETRRFYLHQKSLKAERNYGNKNCSICKKKECKIRQYVEK